MHEILANLNPITQLDRSPNFPLVFYVQPSSSSASRESEFFTVKWLTFSARVRFIRLHVPRFSRTHLNCLTFFPAPTNFHRDNFSVIYSMYHPISVNSGWKKTREPELSVCSTRAMRLSGVERQFVVFKSSIWFQDWNKYHTDIKWNICLFELVCKHNLI